MMKEDGFDNIQNQPIFLKATEILQLVMHLTKSVENTDFETHDSLDTQMLHDYLSYLNEGAMIIPVKLSGAEAIDIYDLKMENASIIRKAAKDMLTSVSGIEIMGFEDTEYLDLLRNEIDEFRILFAEWVKTFDPWNYIIDRWGLFNPPGVNYDDKDPDDDLPFKNPFDDENLLD